MGSEKYLQYFLEMLSAEKGESLNTIEAYRRDVEGFCAFFSKPIEKITSEDIRQYISSLFGYSPKTQARKLSALRSFCKFLHTEKVLAENPAAEIEFPKKEKHLPNFLTPTQIQKMVQTAKKSADFHIRRAGVLINLIFASGLRVSEALTLPVHAVNKEKRQIFVKGKGGKERIVFLNAQSLEDIEDYETYRSSFIIKGKTSPYLFPSQTSKSGHLTRDAFFKTLKKLATLSNLEARFISPHTLRHSFATNLINHDVDLRSIQQMLGHENIATTQIYTHLTTHRLAEAVFSNHPLGKETSDEK